MVGIVIYNVITNPLYPEVLDLLNRKFQDNDQKVMLCVVYRNQSLEVIILELLEYQGDRILITTISLSSAMSNKWEWRGTPVTLLNRYIRKSNANWFCYDNKSGGSMVAK